MLAKSLLAVLSLSVSLAWAASPYQLSFNFHSSGAPSCWPGKEIHDSCDGYQTGCTKDGILVTCDPDGDDPAEGQMIFSNMCDNAECVCIDGKSECSAPDPTKCWAGQIHDPCNGAATGCASGGILVICDGDWMSFKDECGDGFGDGTCHCNDDGESLC